jgi:hypothetical protein
VRCKAVSFTFCSGHRDLQVLSLPLITVNGKYCVVGKEPWDPNRIHDWNMDRVSVCFSVVWV